MTERFLRGPKRKKHLKKRRLETLKENDMREHLPCKPGFTERFDDGTILLATKKKKTPKKETIRNIERE